MMHKFKIVFLDGAEIEVKSIDFSTAYVQAAYLRVKSGDAAARQLLINTKESCLVVPSSKRKPTKKAIE